MRVMNIQEVMYGSTALNSKQLRIASLVAAGMNNQQIAQVIGTTENVVKNYMRVIFDRTGMDTRLQLALWYVRRRWERTHEVYELDPVIQ
jgi:DNA-binding NarL/FixJ family response regulator